MISFENDYNNGVHPQILNAIITTNDEILSGYGNDKYSSLAKEKIKTTCQLQHADVEFLVGGTQTNEIIISTMLRDYEGVIAAETGHINVHEAGAIEYLGYKILSLPHHDGKISSKELDSYLEHFHSNEAKDHMVFPGMLYISQPTEYGTLYTLNELISIHNICQKYNIPIFIDGARLGYALMSNDNDISLNELGKLADIFSIGGTKIGTLCGEAIVFTKNNKPSHFITSIKKRGALLAKGRLLGVQFNALFSNNLYFEISAYVINMTNKMKLIFEKKGYKFSINSPTNQQFIILKNSQIEFLKKHIRFSVWEPYDDSHSVARFVCSWSTTERDLQFLETIL